MIASFQTRVLWLHNLAIYVLKCRPTLPVLIEYSSSKLLESIAAVIVVHSVLIWQPAIAVLTSFEDGATAKLL